MLRSTHERFSIEPVKPRRLANPSFVEDGPDKGDFGGAVPTTSPDGKRARMSSGSMMVKSAPGGNVEWRSDQPAKLRDP